jgi:hypothetical protein
MEMQQMIERLLAGQEQVKEMMERQIRSLASRVEANRKTYRDEMKQEIRAIHEEMMAMLDAHRERMMASLGKTEATYMKTMNKEMESETGCRDVPKEDAVVKPVEGWKKQQKGQKLKDGSHRKLAPAHRGTTHCVNVTWHKRNVVRKDFIRSKVERATWRVGLLRKNLQMHHEGRRGT